MIDTLPASPNGELSHEDYRLKLNEITRFINQLGIRAFGSFDYNDLATQTTPIDVLSGVETTITNDGQGAQSTDEFAPYGVTQIWDVDTDSFDLSQLSIGDHVEIRMQLKVTTTSPNTAIKARLTMAIGTASEYTIPFSNGFYKTATADEEIARFNGFYIGSEDVRDAPTKLTVISDEDCSIKVDGFYCTVTKRA